jgi:hypothetical protein
MGVVGDEAEVTKMLSGNWDAKPETEAECRPKIKVLNIFNKISDESHGWSTKANGREHKTCLG